MYADRLPILIPTRCLTFSLLLLLFALPLPAAAVVVLQYHHVSEDTPAATSVTPKLFAQHMAHIKEAGYQVLRLEDLVDMLKAGADLPDRAVAITFDDAYESIYTEAFPILKQYGWPFTVFLNVQPLEQRLKRFLTWDQVKEMAAAGASIANHSYSHPHMIRRLEGESEDQWRERMRDEILKTERVIAEQTGQELRIFAYPFGEYDQTSKDLLAELGFVAFGQQSGPIGKGEDLLALPRFAFGGIYGDLGDFRTKAATVPMPLRELRVVGGGRILNETLLPEDVSRPRLIMVLENEGTAQRMQCFASGQGAIPLKVEGNQVTAQAEEPLPVGRSRYNCTAMSREAGRFHWHTQAFIRKKADGSWYAE